VPPPRPRPSVVVPTFANPVRVEVEKRVRQRLNIPANQPLPPKVQTLVADAANAATGKALDLAISRDAEAAIRRVYRPAQLEGFKDKVLAARTGIDLIAQSADVDGILARRAELLLKKREALVTAGFTTQEAMEILLADLSGEG